MDEKLRSIQRHEITMNYPATVKGRFITTGRKMGTNIKTMAGHSNGHPRRKITAIRITIITIGETGSASIVAVIKSAVPKRANTEP